MPEGTHIDITDEICKQVEDKVFEVLGRDNPDVESMVSNVAVNAGAGMFERFAQDKLAKVTITFVEYKFRTGPSTRTYLDKLREEVKGIPGAQIRIDREAMGPPTGMPINIEISGDDIEELVIVSEDFMGFIECLEHPRYRKAQIQHGGQQTRTGARHIDREKANQLGISTAQIGMALRTAIYGLEISEFREGDEEYPIQLRLAEKYRNDIAAAAQPGNDGPLPSAQRDALQDPFVGRGQGFISDQLRRDRSASTTNASSRSPPMCSPDTMPMRSSAASAGQLPKFPHPEGITIQFTGEQDMQAETGQFMVTAMFIALALIFVILVAQFNSLAKPLIIISQFFFSVSQESYWVL